MTATSAELLYDGRALLVTYEGDTPASFGVPDWLAGKNAGKRACLAIAGTNYPLRYLCATLHSNVPAVASVAWDAAAFTLTATGAFTNYRAWVSGDGVQAVNKNDTWPIASRDSDNQITLSSGALNATNATYSLYEMDAGQGTKLKWKVLYQLRTAHRVVAGTSGLTFSADSGLIQDVYSNSSDTVSELAVTNSSLMDADGWIDEDALTSATTIYVAPGYGNDANNGTTTGTAVATLTRAAALVTNGQSWAIRILEGTSVAGINWTKGGASWTAPGLFSSYWDAGAGVGTQGVKPQITSMMNCISAGGAVDYSIWRKIHFAPPGTEDCFNSLRHRYLAFDDCRFEGGENAVDLNITDVPPLSERLFVNRCTFIDTINETGISKGLYTSKMSECLIRECHFELTGRTGTSGYGSDIFSRSQYHDAEETDVWVIGCYTSRSDGVQNRPGGCIVDCVFTESHLMGFIGGHGGRIARCYNELGANFGDTSFSGATYTHSSRTLAATGIGTGMGSTTSIYAVSGTGVTVGQYRILSATANAIVLRGEGLGAGADGSTDVGGLLLDLARGFGPENQPANDIRVGHPMLMEMNVSNRLTTYGGGALAFAVTGKDEFSDPHHIILRNSVGYDSRHCWLSCADAGQTPPRRFDRERNVIVESVGTSAIYDQNALSSYTFLNADYNIGSSADGSARHWRRGATQETLATYQAATGKEANSLSAPTLAWVDSSADLGDWAGECGLTATKEALQTAVRARGTGEWPAWADMEAASTFLRGKYVLSSVNGGSIAAGSGALGVFGMVATDVDEFDNFAGGEPPASTWYFINTASGSLQLHTGAA
jgi:hypothetical protein